jgi:hypothetical protein
MHFLSPGEAVGVVNADHISYGCSTTWSSGLLSSWLHCRRVQGSEPIFVYSPFIVIILSKSDKSRESTEAIFNILEPTLI